MKTKKILALLLALSLALSACGDKKENGTKDENKQVEKNTGDTSKDENKDTSEESPSEEVSVEALMKMKPSPAEDFEYIGGKEKGLEIIGYKGHDKLVYIPEEINGIPVTSIKGTFSNNGKGVKGIRLGKNLKVVKFGSFGNNKDIEVFVSEGLEVLEDAAFIKSTNLREVVLNEGLKKMGTTLITDTPVKEIVIPSTVEEVKIGAFGPTDAHPEGFTVKASKKMPGLKQLQDMLKGIVKLELID